jgi:type II secretory pathway pseudopilin PulG
MNATAITIIALLTAALAGVVVLWLQSRHEVAELQEQLNAAIEFLSKERGNAAAQPASTAQPAPSAATQQAPAATQHEPSPRRLFLSRADDKGRFLKATEQFELGNSLYELTTTDGHHGTFTLIDNAEVQQFALLMPTQNLGRACTGIDWRNLTPSAHLLTTQTGQAALNGTCWQVTTPCQLKAT